MKRFTETLTEGLAHMDHVEDFWIANPDAYGQVVDVLESTFKSLAGSASSGVSITTKIDGSPAIVFGKHPKTGEFIIGTKSIFSKSPKYYSSIADTKNVPNKELGRILANAFPYLEQIDTKGKLLQCDLMFDSRILKRKNIDGEPHFVFQPNTIVYAVPLKSDIGDQISRAKIGISVHTEIHGELGGSMNKTQFDASNVHFPPTVWNCPVKIQSHAGVITFTAKQSKDLRKMIDTLRKNGRKYKAMIDAMNVLRGHFRNTFVQYSNAELKSANTRLTLTATKYDRFLSTKYKTHQPLSPEEKATVDEIIDYYQTIIKVKNALVKKLDRISSLDTFVSTPDGFTVTGQEGFVVADIKGGNLFKLVNKLSFTRTNMLFGRFSNA